MMARFLELKKPWGDLICVNTDHICSILADKYSSAGKGTRSVVTIALLSGQSFTADVPYEEFMRMLVPLSLSGGE